MAKRTLAHLSKKVFNTPLFVTQEGLAPIANYLSDPERTMRLMQYEKDIEEETELLRSDFDGDEEYKRYRLSALGVNPDTMVGTVDIKGTLVNRAGQTQACVELTSYERLKKTFEAQINEGAKKIVMQIDSCGGEAYRLFGTANAVKKLAKDNNVELIAYIDGTSASAAYGWASIADEVIANPQGRAGSVGVVVQLYNDSKYLENLGVERSFVYAGKNKIPFDEKGGFTEDFISGLQKSVDKSYAQFTKFIATNRNMSVESVVETNAKVFDAEEALEVGFIDKIMEIEEFEHYVNGESNQSNQRTISYEGNMSDKTPVGSEQQTDLEELTQQLTYKLADSKALVNQKETELKNAIEAKEKLDADYKELQEKLQTEQDSKAKLEAEISKLKADAITKERKEKLEAVLGTENDQVATLLDTTKALDDTSFNAIVTALETKIEKEDQEMGEMGNQAKQDPVVASYQDVLKAKAKSQANK